MPARTKAETTPVPASPARANSHTESEPHTPARAIVLTTTSAESPARDALLEQIRLLGRTLDDLERVRIMNGNRGAAYEREYGSAMPHHDIVQGHLKALEHLAVLELVRAWRKHPLAPWAKDVRGVGEKSIARLIAEIGDPAERENPGKLLAYCGHGEALRKRRKGMSQEELFRCGNPRAKKQVYLIATSMLKAGNRDVYDARREETKDRGWTLGHAHADALRIVGKRFLIELWVAARAGHRPAEAHSMNARAGHRSAEIPARSARAGQITDEIQATSARAGQRTAESHISHARAGRSNSELQSMTARAGHPVPGILPPLARAGQVALETQRLPARAGGDQ